MKVLLLVFLVYIAIGIVVSFAFWLYCRRAFKGYFNRDSVYETIGTHVLFALFWPMLVCFTVGDYWKERKEIRAIKKSLDQ